MKTIYFVRHGESRANVELDGVGVDSSLTQQGQRQAEFVAHRCARLPIDCIIASTYKRAQETGEIIQKKLGKPIEFCDLFVERRTASEHHGMLETEWVKTISEISGYMYEPGFHFSDEENFEDLMIRAGKALDFLAQRKEEHILVVTHGSFLRDMLALMIFKENVSPIIRRSMTRGLSTNNTGLTMVQYHEEENQWSMITWNDHAHLG
ncbi:MAG: histidine phosphatase family protein [Patescibacteria group bacterium]